MRESFSSTDFPSVESHTHTHDESRTRLKTSKQIKSTCLHLRLWCGLSVHVATCYRKYSLYIRNNNSKIKRCDWGERVYVCDYDIVSWFVWQTAAFILSKSICIHSVSKVKITKCFSTISMCGLRERLSSFGSKMTNASFILMQFALFDLPFASLDHFIRHDAARSSKRLQ